jgi:ribosome modulation factor
VARFDANDWGYRSSISAGRPESCPYDREPDRQAWVDGYNEGLRIRPDDVVAARIACGWPADEAAVLDPAS